MSWSQAVEKTVSGLGYELVEVERSAGGLLRARLGCERRESEKHPDAKPYRHSAPPTRSASFLSDGHGDGERERHTDPASDCAVMTSTPNF